MTTINPADGYTREELADMLAKARLLSNAFYSNASRIGNHAFLEFTGLMNEYLKMCHRALEGGQNYLLANVHTGRSLPMEGYEAAYLAEKFECIFGPTLASDTALAQKFVAGILGKEWRKVLGVEPAPTKAGRKDRKAVRK